MKPGRLVAVLALSASALAAQGKRTIAVGDTVRDSLTRRDALLPAESTYTQQWRLAGRAVAKPQDDDSGGHCNARLTVRLPQTGDYFIVVTSSERFATGAFTLSVVPGRKPRSLSPCDR